MKEFSIESALLYTWERKKNTRFYYNVFGWHTYFTLKPTQATPTGKDKKFPRTITLKYK